MSAPKIQEITIPKGAVVVNAFSPIANVEVVIVFRRPFNARNQLKKIRNLRKAIACMGSDLEIVAHIC